MVYYYFSNSEKKVIERRKRSGNVLEGHIIRDNWVIIIMDTLCFSEKVVILKTFACFLFKLKLTTLLYKCLLAFWSINVICWLLFQKIIKYMKMFNLCNENRFGVNNS